MLGIAHRGLHSYGMDFWGNYAVTWVEATDHSSKISVTPVDDTSLRYMVDENTYMSYLIAAHRAKNGDVIPMRGIYYTVNVPWTSEDDAPNAIEVDVQKDKDGNWVAIHDSTLKREVGDSYSGKKAADVSLKGIMRVFYPADQTSTNQKIWNINDHPYSPNLYTVASSEEASWAQIRGGSKIFIQYHVRSIKDLGEYHKFLLQKLYDWKKTATAADKILIARAVQQFYYYMHIYDLQRFYTNGNFTDSFCGTRSEDAKNMKAINCISTSIETEIDRAELLFLRENPGAQALIDTPEKVGMMTGIFQDTIPDTAAISNMNAHRMKVDSRVIFMGLDISNNSGTQYPVYIDQMSNLMRANNYHISHTMNHPGYYKRTTILNAPDRWEWKFMRSGAVVWSDPPTWSRHAHYGIGGSPQGTNGYKPTMLVSDRLYNDRIGYEGIGWNWDYYY
jgi:glycerophosphoryl diester phosphodiesterase